MSPVITEMCTGGRGASITLSISASAAAPIAAPTAATRSVRICRSAISAMATTTGRRRATNWLSPMRNRSNASGSPPNSSSTRASRSSSVSDAAAVSTQADEHGDAGDEEAEQEDG